MAPGVLVTRLRTDLRYIDRLRLILNILMYRILMLILRQCLERNQCLSSQITSVELKHHFDGSACGFCRKFRLRPDLIAIFIKRRLLRLLIHQDPRQRILPSNTQILISNGIYERNLIIRFR